MRLVLLACVLVGCGDPTMIQANFYSRACRAPAECRSVFVGNQCEPCSCPNAAIRAEEWDVYAADRAAAISACDSPPTAPCTTPCERKRAVCPLFDTTGDTAGTCALN
jgi:hypothetical protein